MKYSLLRKVFSSFLLGFCLTAAVFCSETTEVKAEKASISADSGSGILQSGGFLEEDPNQGIMVLDLSTDVEGAKKAIADALTEISPKVDLRSYCIPRSQMPSLISQIINNNPQFFYYSGCSYSYGGAEEYVFDLTFMYSSDRTALQEQVNAYEAAVQKILNGIQPSWSALEKAMYVNDYIAVHCEYDLTYSNHNAYNALVDQTAVCQGYALAYQDLMNRLDIPCEVVSSSKLNHAWNLIQIGNSWYHVDVTWNDPIQDRYGRSRHIYFLKSTGWFKNPTVSNTTAHNADDYVYSGSAGDTDAGSVAFDDCFWNGVDSPFGWYGGYWYANNGGSLYKYQFDNSGVTETTIYKALEQKWPVFGSSNSYWQGAYDGCIIYGNKLYYASTQTIQVLDLASGSTSSATAYTIPDEEKSQGYIYGFCLTDDGILKYGIAQSPNDAAERKETVLHTHSYGSWTVTQTPTCTEAGERVQTCSGCGISVREVIEATGHTPGSEPTCTESQICIVCEAELAPALGHTPGSEPACTEPQICTVCKAELAPALGHTPGSEPACTEPQICIVCKAELAPALGHTPGPEATCTEPQICTVCKAELAPALGHTPGPEATCTEPQICTVCKAELAPALGHTPETETTCTEPQICTVCKAELALALGHTPGPEATCTEPQICTVCKAELAPALGHTPGSEPTCTEPQICTVCKAELVPALGHRYDDGKITKQPSCAEEGIITYTCLNGDDFYTETLPKTEAHSYGEWTVSKDSTCTEEGSQLRTCTICGNTETQAIPKKAHTPGPAATCTAPQLCTVCKAELVPALGHKYNVTRKDSTCREEGSEQKICSLCGNTETQVIAKKAHTPGPAATCTAPQLCTVCSTTLTKATGHVHTGTKVTKEATFLKTGKSSVVCTDCGTVLSTKTISKVKCKKGQTYTVSGYKYKIVSAKTNGKGTVAFAGLTKNVSKVTIKDTVTILGVKFKVVQISDKALKNKTSVTSVTVGKNVQTIGKEAFSGTKKLKTITIKSTKITKIGSNALKNTNAKAKIKVPKAKLSKYKTLFKNKGQKKTVKIS